jgi:hypothetical protein
MNGLLRMVIHERVLDATEDGEYSFPSGKSEDNFDVWMLKRIFNLDWHYGASGVVAGKHAEGSVHQEPDVEYDGKQGKKEEGKMMNRISTLQANCLSQEMMMMMKNC